MRRTLASIALVCSLLVAGCGQTRDDPAHELQARLAAMLDDTAQCPSGTSADLRALLRTTAQESVVHIPAGCYEVTGSITIPDGTVVAGAGMDKTILYRDPSNSSGQGEPIFSASGAQRGATHVSGIAFVGVRNTNDAGEDSAIILRDRQDFRVDHCYFEGFGWAAVRVEGASHGVIDHSIFVDNFKRAIDNLGYGVAVYGVNKWAEDPQAGSAEALFVEDSVFSGCRHAIAASGGAHYVFRYNSVRGNVEACSVDAHGPGFGWPHGTRYVEIYGNTLEDPVHKQCGIGIRGGDGVIFRNRLRGFTRPIVLILEWGTPEDLRASYPAKDQVRDLWIWHNEILDGSLSPEVDAEATGFIELGRDYYTEPKPGYEPYPYPHPLATGGPFDAGAIPP